MGKGSIMVCTKKGEKKEIQNVYFSSGMKKNLSVGKLIQNRYKLLMQNNKCFIHEKDGSNRLLVAVQMRKNQIFPLRIETWFSSQASVAPPKNACTVVHQQSSLRSTIEDPSKLWHLRYGHLGFDGLNLFSKKRMVDGLPSIVDSYDKCKTCILGKQRRLPFNFWNSRRVRVHYKWCILIW